MCVCVGRESVTQTIPKPELLPLARIVCSLEAKRFPLAKDGGSSSLARVLGDTPDDGRVFVAYQPFDSEMLIPCIRQAYQDIFSMVEVTVWWLWSSIRPFIRCTGNPEAKDTAERVSHGLVFVYAICGKLVRCIFDVIFCL